MATFTIQDEDTRRVLECALWFRAAIEAEEADQGPRTRLGSSLVADQLNRAGEGWLRGDPTAMRRGDTALLTLAVQTIRADIERVRATALGESVEISIPDAELPEEFDFCAHSIEDGFWDRPVGERPVALAVHDAAVALLAIVGPVEAVA
jgi:hypothetical protein